MTTPLFRSGKWCKGKASFFNLQIFLEKFSKNFFLRTLPYQRMFSSSKRVQSNGKKSIYANISTTFCNIFSPNKHTPFFFSNLQNALHYPTITTYITILLQNSSGGFLLVPSLSFLSKQRACEKSSLRYFLYICASVIKISLQLYTLYIYYIIEHYA